MDSIIKNLDLNAKGMWLSISLVIILLLYILIMPKKEINWREVYITIGVIGLLTWISDNIFAGFLDLVDFGHPKLSGIGELLTYSFIPSSLAVIYLNYLNNSNKWRLVIAFVVISVLIEWAVVKVGYMELKGWNHLFSIPIFLFVYSYFLPLHLKIIKCYKDN
ncbi:hypothetical protein [Bacillus sp. Au-Bac7]|uniref:hypothetical protein n=1 Tax=Bacillus sp. Au-Bac7 TaxID=2906458 RepID=UPI001E5F1B85|nr:hypothetical protein [Bacillus sp. Au-Bac7]MCE4052113.1 hypothetical protein [Bacillus sp. Au-Bac7]